MILKRLELSGFKSFAKPTVLQFPSAVTAVVGPNGSGKSNIAEASRWVLGEQSMKSLRGKKGEDLIFNGSQSAAKMGRASVSLIFDNKSKIIPIDFDEIVITRLVHRSGENEYLINDSPVRLKDTTEILGSIGLGASSHHIISQGEADRFLNASPKDRKEMIEEALGLKIYRIKKADAEKRLEKTAENIKQVESLRREIQHQLKFLKKEAEKIEEADKFKNELKDIYAQFIPRERDYLKKESDKIAAEKNEIIKDIKAAEKTKAVFAGQPRIGEAGDIARKAVKEIETTLAREESELGKLRSSRNSLERELGKLEGIMEYRQSLSAKSSENNKKLPPIPRQEVLEIVEAVRESAILGASNSDIAEARKIFEKIALSAKEFIAKISEKKDNIIVEENGAGDLKKKKNEIQIMISDIEKKEKEITENITWLKFEMEESRRKIAEMEKENYQADARSRELKGHLARLSLEEDKIRLRTDELKREEAEAGALLGREFVDSIPRTILNLPRVVLGIDGELNYQDREKFLRQAERLKIRLENCGAVGGEVLDEYNQAKQRDEGYEKELNDLATAEKSLRGIMAELADKIESDFSGGVEKINQEFRKFFVSVFGGGKAELSLVKIAKRKNKEEGEEFLAEEIGATNEDKEEEGEIGVEISVSHPQKRISSLEMLSGGERSLVAISLLFAMSQVNPPPFLILDETDAALDEANSQKYALMLKSLGEKTQLIVITHNRETMRQADIIYGITMSADGISRLLSIKFDDAKEYAG